MAKQADVGDLKSPEETHAGSSPATPKKQRIVSDRAMRYQIEAENLFPIRYQTLKDAEKNRNPLKFGDVGYERAQYEQRFILNAG